MRFINAIIILMKLLLYKNTSHFLIISSNLSPISMLLSLKINLKKQKIRAPK